MRGVVRWLAAWPAYRWVLVMVIVYVAIALTGTWANYVDLHIGARQDNILDLSINQQALSSTIHSNQPYPFYESVDCELTGRCSFLLVHPVFFAYVVTVPYAAWPSAFTLFALQDICLGLAALPLFAISRIVTKSNRLSLVIAATYLAWWPAFTTIFSFHWEAFVPLELFVFFWLWLTHRYWLAVPVAVLSFVTLEVMPVLIFLVGVFFLLDWFWSALKYLWAEVQYLAMTKTAETAAQLSMALAEVRRGLFRPRLVRASLLLLLGSVVGYLVLHEFVVAGGSLLGLPPLPTEYMIPVSQPEHDIGFSVQHLEFAWQTKLTYWLVIYGTLALIPLFAPRTLVISAPWILLGLVSAPGYYHLGNHYALITAGVVFIGFLYGAARLKRWADGSHDGWQRRFRRKAPSANAANPAAPPNSSSATVAQVSDSASPAYVEEVPDSGRDPPSGAGGPDPPEPAPGSERPGNSASGGTTAPSSSDAGSTHDPRAVLRRRRRRATIVLATALVAVIAVNLVLNPFSPFAAGVEAYAGPPLASETNLGLWGFNDSSFRALEEIASIVGDHAIVAVAPPLFTFVANDPYAYPLSTGLNLSRLPFDAVNGTQFVLYLPHGGPLPGSLATTLYNTSVFGVRAWVPSTYLGYIWLFQRGYTGPTQILGNAGSVGGGTYTAGEGLVPEVAGETATNSTSLSGSVIEAAPNPQNSSERDVGHVFSGPATTLSEGSFEVDVNLSGTQVAYHKSAAANTSVVLVQLTGEPAGIQPETIANATLNLSWFGTGNWTSVEFTVVSPTPIVDFAVTGGNLRPWFGMQVNYVSVTPLGP